MCFYFRKPTKNFFLINMMEVSHCRPLGEATILLCVLRKLSHLSPVPSLHFRKPHMSAVSSSQPLCWAGGPGHEPHGPASTETLHHHWWMDWREISNKQYNAPKRGCIPITSSEKIKCKKWEKSCWWSQCDETLLTCLCTAAAAGAASRSLRSCTGSQPAPKPPLNRHTIRSDFVLIPQTEHLSLSLHFPSCCPKSPALKQFVNYLFLKPGRQLNSALCDKLHNPDRRAQGAPGGGQLHHSVHKKWRDINTHKEACLSDSFTFKLFE